MPLQFTCPACGGKLQAPDAMAGRRGACNFCHARIVAPATSGGTATILPPDPAPGSMPKTLSGGTPASPPPPLQPARGTAEALDVAPFWTRASGFVVDSVLLLILYLLVRPVFEALNPWKLPDLMGLLQTLTALQSGEGAPEQMVDLPDVTSALFSIIFSLLWTSLVHWLYYALFESAAPQATPGKMLLGVKVTDLQGHRIGFGRATMREVGRGFSTMLCFLGYLMAAFTEKRQALHDYLTQTLVLNR